MNRDPLDWMRPPITGAEVVPVTVTCTAGVPVTLQRLPGAGHGGPAFGLPAVGKLTNTFFDKYLKGVDAKIEPLPEDAVTVPAIPAPKK